MLTSAERADLRRAKTLLEQDNLLVRLGGVVGRSVDALAAPVLRALPAQAREAVQSALERGLGLAFDTAARTVRRRVGVAWIDRIVRARWINMAAVAATGAGGGLAGLPGVLAELPFTTTMLMRAIAQVAAEEGEDLADPQVKLECLSVFALGSPGGTADLDYYALRVGFARALGGAAGRTLDQVMPQAITAAAARLNLPIAYKVAAETVPLLGAAAGAAVNLVFADHFQGKARGHFIVRRLERVHGERAIQEAYEAAG